jgi:hypothetical protein
MPPKDDDDPASTKEVVTKKQKQLLNREELNLAAIAEAFDGILIEREIETKGQQSLPGMGKKKKKGPKTVSPTDAKKSLERSMEPPDRKAKYQTNRPVSAKQVQQFDKDIAGQAADQRASAGGKPGAGRTGSLRGQTITKGPFKDATPIGRSEREILRKFAKSQGVGQNPLRAEPGSGAELTQGRKRSLKASARRAVEKREQAAKTKAYKKEVTRRGSEVLRDVQAQGKREAKLRASQQRGAERGTATRMGAAATRMINRQGSELLKQIQKQNRQAGVPKGQLSLPGLGRAFGRGAGRRAAAAQDAARDMQTDRVKKGFADLSKAVKNVDRGPIPKTSALVKVDPKSSALTIPKTSAIVKTEPKTSSLTKTQPKTGALVAPEVQRINVNTNVPTPKALSPAASRVSRLFSRLKKVRVSGGSPQAMALQAAGQLAAGEVIDRTAKRLEEPMGRAFRRGLNRMLGSTEKMKQLTPGDYDMAGPNLTPDIIRRLKPKTKPLPGGDPETAPKPDTEPSQQPDQDTKKKPTSRGVGVKGRTGIGVRQTPGDTQTPLTNPLQTPIIPGKATGVGTRTGPPRRGNNRRLPGLGLPSYRGKIGRRSNPQ